MKGIFTVALGLAVSASTFAAAIDIDTGFAPWMVTGPGYTGPAIVVSAPNGTWAPAPAGASWVSWGANESVSCAVGQLPGNGCASTNFNPNGDTWVYTLNIAAGLLGATSGDLNFVFGGDDSVEAFVGGGPGATSFTTQIWNQGGSLGAFAQLGCSNAAQGATNAGSSQTSYNACTTTIPFDATFLNTDGSLTITAFDFNAPISGCPTCGNPTGFVLGGDALTGLSDSPEPATFGVVALAGLAGFMLRRKRQA
jgi:hypothetical protein